MRIAGAPLIRLALALGFWLGCSASAQVLAQQDVQATPELLVGKWRGEQQTSFPQEIKTFKVELEVAGAPSLKGRFTHESGTSWQTPLELRSDKVLMVYEREKREFVLKKGSGGELLLETSYRMRRQVMTSNTVQLRKAKQ